MQNDISPARAHADAAHTPRAVRAAQARGGDLASLRRAQQYGAHPAAQRSWDPFVPGLGYAY